ncbi:MAG: YxeA family protein [Propionibacteriaceae bacterium]|jgi:uncharacterized protein YxeA|nr:YxeA family protein [Propionibacteriaceae bacterium]
MNKGIRVLLGVVVVAVLACAGVVGFGYYQSKYAGADVYAVTPAQVPERIDFVDDSGNRIKDSKGNGLFRYRYEISGYTLAGEPRKLVFSISGADPKPLEPGTYLKFLASPDRVIEGPKVVAESDVPKALRGKLA